MATAKMLTTKQVIAGFGVGHMTVYNWRKGSEKQPALPTNVDEAGRVSFKLQDVLAWAKKHGRRFDATCIDAVAVDSKPGPKPKAQPSESPAMKDVKARKPSARLGAVKADKGMSNTGRKIAVAARKADKKAQVAAAAA